MFGWENLSPGTHMDATLISGRSSTCSFVKNTIMAIRKGIGMAKEDNKEPKGVTTPPVWEI